MTRARRLGLVAAAAALIGGCGVALVLDGLGSEASPPDPQGPTALDVTAPVERRVLESVVVARGTIVSPSRTDVEAPPLSEGSTQNVVTDVPAPVGTEVAAGGVLVAVNGRPILVWPSRLPLYQELHPGMTGPDVEAVQDALAVIGLPVPDEERGTFGPSTRQSVTEVYRRAGYEPTYTLGSAAAVEAAIGAADREVDAARAAVNAARAAGLVDPSAELAYEQARSAAAATRANEGVTLRPAEFVAATASPVTVLRVAVEVGSRVEEGSTLVTFGNPQLVVEIGLTAGQAAALTTEFDVEVTAVGYTSSCTAAPVQAAGPPASEPTPAEPTSGTADGMADPLVPGAESSSPFHMTVGCAQVPPPTMLDSDVQAVLTTRISTEPTLVVPATALATSADGATTVHTADGVSVPVTVLGEADGFVAIEADGDLAEGDDVRVRNR